MTPFIRLSDARYWGWQGAVWRRRGEPRGLVDLLLELRQEEYPFERLPQPSRIAVAAALALMIICFAANQISAFIYFQF